MTTIEIILLVIAYSLMTVTIFLEVICYMRNLESLQTIAFTVSLLFLIITLTISPLLHLSGAGQPTNVFTLLAMALVGLTTPLNVWEERKHKVPGIWKTLLISFSVLLIPAVVAAHFFYALVYFQYIVAAFLGTAVFLSMALVRVTRPKPNVAHREKADRLFSVAFMILVPLSLLASYAFENLRGISLKFGFTLPVIFILLAASKLLDDAQRLRILNPAIMPSEQHFRNYSLTGREQEMALLLASGKTYKQISEELFISLPTVKTHAGNIYKKCGVSSRHELTALMVN